MIDIVLQTASAVMLLVLGCCFNFRTITASLAFKTVPIILGAASIANLYAKFMGWPI